MSKKQTRSGSTKKSAGSAGKSSGKKSSTSKSAGARKTSRLTKSQLEEIRQMLLSRREALVEGVREEYSEVIGRNRTMMGDNTDIAQDLSEESVAMGILMNEEEELAQVEAALQRIDDGTYGFCETCGEPIPQKRLKFLPYATKCVKCKSLEEQQGSSAAYTPRLSFGAMEDVVDEDDEDDSE